MTTMSITAFTCSACEKIATMFNNLFRKVRFGMQMSANQRVARELIHLGFHQQKEFNQLLQRMNDQAIEEYYDNKK